MFALRTVTYASRPASSARVFRSGKATSPASGAIGQQNSTKPPQSLLDAEPEAAATEVTEFCEEQKANSGAANPLIRSAVRWSASSTVRIRGSGMSSRRNWATRRARVSCSGEYQRYPVPASTRAGGSSSVSP